jgi:uncharacterized protein YecT (DUF1311 family)
MGNVPFAMLLVSLFALYTTRAPAQQPPDPCMGSAKTTSQKAECETAELHQALIEERQARVQLRPFLKALEAETDLNLADDAWRLYAYHQCAMEMAMIQGSGVAFGWPACRIALIRKRTDYLRDLRSRLEREGKALQGN